jgi:hypothetical protein
MFFFVLHKKMVVINTNTILHDTMVAHWEIEEREYLKKTRRIPTRFERMVESLKTKTVRHGDSLVEKTKELFHHGIGVKWGDDQIRVFMAFVASCLPLIYGETWPEEKARVMRNWELKQELMYSLVNMARRNGKTFVTSGTAAALLLTIPNIKIAIFSTCKRTSQMMMTAILEMIDRSFEKGTHVNRQDYVVLSKNMEQVCYEGPDGTKRILSSFPGSVRVSERMCFFFVGVTDC